MFYNASIDYQDGMELTKEVFLSHEADLERKWELVLRTALKGEGIGLLSGFEHHIHGIFADRMFEMNNLKFTALTASGHIMSVDDDLKVEVSQFRSPECFVCVRSEEGKTRKFERSGIPYTAPCYELCVRTLPELLSQGKEEDILPLVRFLEKDDSLVMDEDYIIPSFSMDSNPVFKDFKEDYIQSLEKLIAHANLESAYTKRSLEYFHYYLSTLKKGTSLKDFTSLLKALELALGYHIVEGLGKTLPRLPEEISRLKADARNQMTPYDLHSYLLWLKEYLQAMPLILDEVVIEDDSIDPEQLKKAIKEELKDELLKELKDELYSQLHEELLKELTGSISKDVTSLIQDRLRPELRSDLYEGLRQPLYDKLHQTLYDELYSLLRPKDKEQEDIFTPLI